MKPDYNPEKTKKELAREAASVAAFSLLYGFGYWPNGHRPRRKREQRTVVFVHGLWANRATFFPMQAYLKFHGYKRQYSFNYCTSGCIQELARDLKQRLAKEVGGGRIDLVCHSLGGLVARTYVQLLGGHRRVDRLITLATPHYGTYPSKYMPTSLISQLDPDSNYLRMLNDLPAPQGVESISFAAERDLIVMPSHSALAPHGEGHILTDKGHLDIMLSTDVFRQVRGILNRPTLLERSKQARDGMPTGLGPLPSNAGLLAHAGLAEHTCKSLGLDERMC